MAKRANSISRNYATGVVLVGRLDIASDNMGSRYQRRLYKSVGKKGEECLERRLPRNRKDESADHQETVNKAKVDLPFIRSGIPTKRVHVHCSLLHPPTHPIRTVSPGFFWKRQKRLLYIRISSALTSMQARVDNRV